MFVALAGHLMSPVPPPLSWAEARTRLEARIAKLSSRSQMIARRLLSGDKARDLATELGVSKQRISQVRRLAGLEPHSQIWRDHVLYLADRGLTYDRISRCLGVSIQTVRRICVEQGLVPRHQRIINSSAVYRALLAEHGSRVVLAKLSIVWNQRRVTSDGSVDFDTKKAVHRLIALRRRHGEELFPRLRSRVPP